MRKINLEKEREFENLKTLDPDTRDSQDKFYRAVQLNIDSHESRICREVKGKIVLEIGCSVGTAAVQYSKNCKSYFGCDLSDEAIKFANSRNVENAEFICCDAHQLPFNDLMFDVVIVNSLLHHLDLKIALVEIERVLKDDGRLYFREPLGMNLLHNLYRNLTPNARTPDERPFTYSDVKLIKEIFKECDSSFIGFFSLLGAYMNLGEGFQNVLLGIDRVIARTPLKWQYWMWCGVLSKN